MKCYVLIVSDFFPKYHKRAGEETGFSRGIINKDKIHTLRLNWKLWEKRFEKISKGEAYISVRKWSDKPYRSKQVLIRNFYKEDGIGFEIMRTGIFGVCMSAVVYNRPDYPIIAKNDGLTHDDFTDWFKDVPANTYIGCIHFTEFRYDVRNEEFEEAFNNLFEN